LQALKTLLERHWPLDHVVPGGSLQRFPTRNVVSIRSEQGQFVVKAYDDEWALGLVRPSVAEIDQRLSIFDYLARNDFGQAPSLLKTRTGRRFVRAGGRTVYILERIRGGQPPDTSETWVELGHLAALLNSLPDFPHEYAISVAGTIAELTRNADRYPFRSDFLRLVSTLDVLVDQPTCPIHGEINLANSLVSAGGRIFLLDWDQAGTGPWALEPGYPLITTFLSEDLVFDAASAAAFYGSWAGGKPISAGRKDLIFTAAILHALRYLEFGDRFRRWTRIQHALAHRDQLLAVLDASLPSRLDIPSRGSRHDSGGHQD
jgi:hypothetical protein